MLLLDSYERDQTASTPSKHPPPPFSSTDSADSDHDRYYEFVIPGIQPVDEEEEVHVLQYSIKSTSIAEEEQLQDLDEEKANDLMNSVIDWEDETEYQEVTSGDDCLAEDGSSDEEFVPSICVRTGGALPNPFPIDALPVIALDETVHGVPNLGPKSEDIPPFPEHEQVLCEDDLIDKHANITYDDHLHRLATFLQLPIQKCPYSNPVTGAECAGNPPFEVTMASRGTGTILEWFCPFGHSVWRWNSQPLLKFGIQAGDFMLSSNILLSGNNYTKIALLFKFMNMGMVADEAFLNIQDTYCVDAVKELWQEKRADVIGRLHSKDHVVVLGDCRMDSPGHCAQYCTYATIEQESRDIIHIVTVDKRDTNRKSVIMEKEAFIRTMDVLLQEIPIKEVVSDAHRQISALMNPERGKYKPWGLQHSLDIWHGAKNLAKKLHAAGLMKDQSAIMYWIKDIVNHFWYCCKQAKTEEQFKTMWQGVLHHVRDRHQWPFGSCDHGPLDDRSRDKPWMVQRSAAHQALTAIVLDEHWLKDVKKFLNFRTTSDLEAFKNHILMYAGKQFSYSPSIIEARILLAALDYNHHNHRPPALTHDGRKMNKRYYNKKSKRWSVYTMKVPKDYSYISELQKIILRKQLKFGEGLPKKRPLEPDDPGRLGLVTEIPPPPTAELPRTQITRGEAVSPDGSDPVIPEIVAVIDEESGSSDGGEEVSGEGDMDSSDSDWDPSVDHSFLSEERMDKDSNIDEQNLNNSPVGYKHRQLCTECGKFFINIKPHTCEYKIKPYSCNICGKRCVSEHALKIHCKIHKEDYVHQCKFCFATFKTRLDKLAHEDAHPSSHKPYQCPDCSETFSTIRARRVHQQGHRGSNNCRVCDMEFDSLSRLQRHMAVHTGVKQFVCQVCQRSFNQASHLKSHMRLHTGERPFKCLHCDKSFNHNVSLKSHVQRYHSQVLDFKSKQLTEKNSNKSEAEKDEMNQKDSNTGDGEEDQRPLRLKSMTVTLILTQQKRGRKRRVETRT
ncbi:uncharacterized protein ACJ7VT_017694 isoform 2-T2 [Polymixia lowei]